jgi:hypothetical protein
MILESLKLNFSRLLKYFNFWLPSQNYGAPIKSTPTVQIVRLAHEKNSIAVQLFLRNFILWSFNENSQHIPNLVKISQKLIFYMKLYMLS